MSSFSFHKDMDPIFLIYFQLLVRLVKSDLVKILEVRRQRRRGEMYARQPWLTYLIMRRAQSYEDFHTLVMLSVLDVSKFCKLSKWVVFLFVYFTLDAVYKLKAVFM